MGAAKKKKSTEHQATCGNLSLLLQKFKCRPCFVPLMQPGKSPKENTAPKSTQMLTIIKTSVPNTNYIDAESDSQAATKKILRRRVSTNEPNKCGKASRSVELSVTSKHFIHEQP